MCMSVFALHTRVCMYVRVRVCVSQLKKALEALEWEVQVIMNHHVSDRNWIHAFLKSNKRS